MPDFWMKECGKEVKGYVVMNNKKDGSRAIFYFDLKCLVNFENDYLKNRITDIQTGGGWVIY